MESYSGISAGVLKKLHAVREVYIKNNPLSVETVPPDMVNRVRYSDLNITAEVDPNSAAIRERTIYPALFFAQASSLRFVDRYLRLLDAHQRRQGINGSNVACFLAERGMIAPTFRIYDSNTAELVLAGLAFENAHIDPRHLLMIFDLPEQLHRWYYPDGDACEMGVPWRSFYASLIQGVKDSLGQESRCGALGFNRLNEIGDHSPGEFYYVLEVGTDVYSKSRRSF